MSVGGTGVSVGGTGVSVGGTGVSVGGSGVWVSVNVGLGVLVKVSVAVGVAVLVGVRVAVRVDVGVRDGVLVKVDVGGVSSRLVLVGKMGRRVEVALAVTEAVGGFADSNVKTRIPVGVSVTVTVAAGRVAVKVGVKKSLANSALVRARSVLKVAVGERPALGISSLGSMRPCCDPLVIMIGSRTPMRQAAKTANTTTIEYWSFTGLLSFLPSFRGKHQPLLFHASCLLSLIQ